MICIISAQHKTRETSMLCCAVPSCCAERTSVDEQGERPGHNQEGHKGISKSPGLGRIHCRVS